MDRALSDDEFASNPALHTLQHVFGYSDFRPPQDAIIDTVLDIDYAAGRITHDSADKIIDFVRARSLEVAWIIETHVHADHLSAAPYLQQELGGQIGIGHKITEVQEVFGKVFNEGTEFQRDGSQFDALFEDGDTYRVGAMT